MYKGDIYFLLYTFILFAFIFTKQTHILKQKLKYIAFIFVTVTEGSESFPISLISFTLPLLSFPPLAHPPSPFSLHWPLVLYSDLGQVLSYFILSHRVPDLQFDLFSINVDHTGPKLHTCQ